MQNHRKKTIHKIVKSISLGTQRLLLVLSFTPGFGAIILAVSSNMDMADTMMMVSTFTILGFASFWLLVYVILWIREGYTQSGTRTSHKNQRITEKYKRLIANLSKMNSDPQIPLTIFLDSPNVYSFGWKGNIVTGKFTLLASNGFMHVGYEMEPSEQGAHSSFINEAATRQLKWKFPADKDQNEITKSVAIDLEVLISSV